MVEAYWNVGREIVAKQGDEGRAKYGDGLVKALAVRLTAEFGDGFTASNLFNMRKFYLTFPKFYALRRELHAERKGAQSFCREVPSASSDCRGTSA